MKNLLLLILLIPAIGFAQTMQMEKWQKQASSNDRHNSLQQFQDMQQPDSPEIRVNRFRPDYEAHEAFAQRKNVSVNHLKSAQESKYLLDSIYNYYFTSPTDSISQTIYYKYNTNGKITLQTNYRWDSDTKQWVENDKNESVYDAKGNKILQIYSGWDNVNKQWEVTSKFEFEYDTEGNNIFFISSDRNSATNQWTDNMKVEYAYDALGNQTLYIMDEWDSKTNQWVRYYKNKYEQTYDALGNTTLYSKYDWDSETNQWVEKNKYEFLYDAQGNATLEIGYNWESESNQWVFMYKSENVFDTQRNITTVMSSNWDSVTSQWIVNRKSESVDDAHGNEIFYACYGLDSETNEWFGEWKTESVHDEQGNTTMWSWYNWDKIANEWVISHKEFNYYSLHNVTGLLPTTQTDATNIYPNPTNDILYFNSKCGAAKVAVYSLSGQLVQETNVNNNNIDVSQLAPGFYTIAITQNGQLTTAKFVKQ